MKHKLLFLATFFALVCALSVCAYAETAEYSGSVISADGFGAAYNLTDGNERTYATADSGSISINNEQGIASLYVVFNRLPAKWQLSDGTKTVTCGENTFLHEFVDVKERLGSAPTDITLTFPENVSIAEIYAFTDGDIPEWVQRWQPPCEKADLVMFSSHADDEHLFFAGVLPYYAVERNLSVQVVYIINHFDTYARPHEQLDGLWAVGIRNYPVMTDFPDLFSESEEYALAVFSAYGVEFSDFTGYITEQIRRFKPLVIMTHDIKGEYGHGTHILTAKAVMEAVESSADPSYHPESAEKYGVWEPQKTYLHLYPENPITMNWDVPLDSFGGKTAFEVSRLGFDRHESQHWTWFYGWVYGKNYPINAAKDIRSYSPCSYGLYKTTVGSDVIGGDFFENVVTYPEQEAIAKAEAERLEAERLAAEKAEQERLEAERLAAEKAAEEARLAEEQRLEAERLAAEKAAAEKEIADRNAITMFACVFGGAAIIILLIATIILQRKRNK